jgi:cobalt-zinc-cadmium efflux system outer membrane protein
MQLGGTDSQYYGMVSQEIVTRHKLDLDAAAACREVYQAELRFLRARYDLLTAVRRDYFTVLAMQRRLLVLDRLIKLSSDLAESGDRLQKAGEGTRGDTLLFEIELEKAQVARDNAAAELHAARRQLATDLGLHDAPDLAVVGDLLEEPSVVTPFVEAVGYVPRNSEVQIAEQEVDRSRFLLKRAEVQPFPNVTVNAGYMNQVMAPHNLAILQAEMPIPLWNKNQGNIRAAQATVAKSQQAVARTQLDIARQLADAIGRFQQSEQQVTRYRNRILPRAREGVDVVRGGIEGGQLELLRLLQAQRALIDASLLYLTALEMRWKAAADIAGMVQLDVFPRGPSSPMPESDDAHHETDPVSANR